MKGQIVIVSGTTGAGKTTTCGAFARRAEKAYLMLGMDLLVGSMFPGKYTLFGAKKDEGYGGDTFGPMARRAIEAMHEMIAAASRAGQNMVIDHSLFLDPPLLQDCIWRMADVPVLFVNLKPSREVLKRRISERKIELPPPMLEAVGGPEGVKRLAVKLVAMTPWFYEHVYQNDIYDLELDSSRLSPDEVCEKIEARLAQAPGMAFEKLRQRYLRPSGITVMITA
jgi:chloramphenicol 3-O-phosphotransferase